MARKKSTPTDDKTLWSALIVLIGVGILGVNIGVIQPEIARYWPIVLVIIGLLGLSGGLSKK
jgi:hypothetical protein